MRTKVRHDMERLRTFNIYGIDWKGRRVAEKAMAADQYKALSLVERIYGRLENVQFSIEYNEEH